MLTDFAARKMAEARWVPHPDVQAALDYVVKLLTNPESDGISKLERIFKGCDYENQRNREAETFAIGLLGKRFQGDYISFQADCPDDTRCRFHLRVARTHDELAKMPPAHAEHFLNLLRPLEEGAVAPKQAEAPRPKPQTPKTESKTTASQRPAIRKATLGKQRT